MSKETSDYKKNERIDLVDIITVIIKRKWFLIGLIIPAFLISATEIFFQKEKNIVKILLSLFPQVKNAFFSNYCLDN